MTKKFMLALAAMLAVATAGRAQAVISCDKTNILYSGIDNPISVAVAGEKASDITVSIADGNGKLTKAKEAGHYIIRPIGDINSITLDVNKKGKKVATQKFKVRPIPTPEIRLAGYRDGDRVLHKALTEGSRFVAIRPEGFDFEMAPGAMRIMKVEAFISNKPFEGIDRLTPEMAAAIRRTEMGEIVFIDVTVHMPDGRPVHTYMSIQIIDNRDFDIVPYLNAAGKQLLDANGRPLYVEVPIEKDEENESEDDED